MRFVSTNTLFDELWLAEWNRALHTLSHQVARMSEHVPINQISLNAPARDRAHHRAILTQRHDLAHGPRCRALSAHHSREQRPLTCHAPIAQLAQDHHILVFHGNLCESMRRFWLIFHNAAKFRSTLNYVGSM
jgi:hypothetical protein